jgi:hypothetical protein
MDSRSSRKHQQKTWQRIKQRNREGIIMEISNCKYGVSKTFDLPFIEYGATDFKTGATLATGDVKISKNNGAFINIATLPTINGAWMEVTLSASEMEAGRIKVQIIDQTATKIFEDTGAILNTDLEDIIWDARLTGATHNEPTSSGRRLRAIGDVVSGEVDDGAAGLDSFITDLTGIQTDHYADQTLLFTTGNLAGMSRLILAYNESTKLITIEEDLPEAPANGDEFDINPVHIHPISQIVQEIVDDPAYGLAELLTAIKTRLASRPYTTEHPPATTDVTNGTVLEGDNDSVQTLNQAYLKIQETGMFKINHTFTGIDEVHSQIYLTYRYFGTGSTNHRIKVRVWSYVLSEMVDITGEDRDLPATNEDRTLIFDLPGTLADYFDGSLPNLTAELEIEHISNASDEHFFWLDTIGFGGLETIYSAPDNESIEEIREFTETFVQATVLAYPGEFGQPPTKSGGHVLYSKETLSSFPYDLRTDITGKTIKFMAKLDLSDEDASAAIPLKDITSSVTDDANGLGLVPLTEAESNLLPKTYYAEVQSVSVGGEVEARWLFRLEIVDNVIDGA